MKKSYIVFGGSGGIGFESAKLLTDGHVVIADLNEEALEQAKVKLEPFNVQAHTIKCDVTNKDDVVKVAELASSLGQIQTVINAAGISSVVPNAPLILKVNLVGSAIIARELLAYANPGMTMVFLGSMLGFLVPRNAPYDDLVRNSLDSTFIEKATDVVENNPKKAYGLSKYGVHRLCEDQALAFGKKGARILSVSPGIVDTQMLKESPQDAIGAMLNKTPLGRAAQPEEIATLIKFLASDQASFITGCDVRIDGGLVHHLL